ncbi:hypothetical protein JOB18_039712 [Solea senegalensis]|uniref:Uncharacterized protein n=1 Tax=Solea senegalensis TaxID=28829 RepID=A0AAV6TAF5_SOLSE|nr:hypothetical protein JOB18_039712 [Solea senegalensis]
MAEIFSFPLLCEAECAVERREHLRILGKQQDCIPLVLSHSGRVSRCLLPRSESKKGTETESVRGKKIIQGQFESLQLFTQSSCKLEKTEETTVSRPLKVQS